MVDINKVLILDCETGGLNPKIHGLCSVSISLEDGRNEKTWFIKPQLEKRYDKEALEINKLSLEFLKEKGITVQTFIKELLQYIEKNFKSKSKIILLGHNIPFDIGFLCEAFEESYLNYNDYFSHHYIDTKQIALTFQKFNLIPKFVGLKLITLYIYFFGRDEIVENAHNSLNDIRMTCKIYFKMGEIVTTKKII